MTDIAKMLTDSATLGFVQSQATHVEKGVYKIKYPNIQYSELIPVDTSAPEWIDTVTFYSSDDVGAAKFISGTGDDIPFVDTSRNQYMSEVHMAAIGYDWSIEDVAKAQLLKINLKADKASAANRAYHQMVDTVALQGDTTKGFNGIMNVPGITTVVAPNAAAVASSLWTAKTSDEVLLDINNILAGVYIDSLGVELADTILMGEQAYVNLATKRIPNTDVTLLKYIMENNILKTRYNRNLTIRTVRGLETAGVGAVNRVVAYRRDPEVLKMHIPMPLKFMPVQINNLRFKVPGIFRLGGLDVRLPGAFRYLDGI